MKKLSSVQKKQQALVMDVVTTLEQQAMQQLAGVQQCWFSMEYNVFPSSLLVRLQFVEQAALDAAQAVLLPWQKKLSGLLLKKGVVLKDMRKHLVFTLSGPEG
ncbi:MAG: hypothetical protein NWQ42_12755 [Alishewanella sp.]|uniref:hypothetical protein n=1 Tax=Gammaproteobacteria TaxID=1236 RepID=UPI001E643C45|nr:hypothetical protein [Rheinheimera sp. UJ51]MCC5450728.1 hypothetical protein [Rheinheimera sp. UJ51]MDP4944363.1 hypothetical protein [Alishewanella sp.]MDP5036978.1 hypothetical protein [Alishewanella sp.]MDP5187405.1 hypothetical protein [Alishewanella sp.]